ncbi:Sec-independent protein translocase protein TatB, partial [Roseomonas sp. NAR14]
MFDLAWSEIALIAVVALVVIGPKDMPGAIRGLARMVQKARRMAGEFQGHVDEMVREAKLDDVRNQINEIRNFDFKGAVERTVDNDGSLRKSFTEDPFHAPAGVATTPIADPGGGAPGDAAPAATPAEPASPPAAPAFIPPAAARAAAPAFPSPEPAPPPSAFVPPAFVPPGVTAEPSNTLAAPPLPAAAEAAPAAPPPAAG